MAICAVEDLTDNLEQCGRKALAKGLFQDVYVGSLSQHKPSITYDTDNDQLIIGLTLPTGGPKLLRYTGASFSNQETNELQVSEYSRDFLQKMRLVIFSRDAKDEKQLAIMKDKEDLFFIYKLRNGIWKAQGLEVGLQVASMTNDSNDDNLKGAWVVTSQGVEPKMPLTIKHTATTGGADDTDTYLLALVKTS